jgi:tRNA dimethylallyltransferase
MPVSIINADASQVYTDLRILSARPSEGEVAEAPHALFGHIDGSHAYSAAEWAADARIAVSEARAERRLPILVGGTGLYLRTLLDGIAPVPEIDADIRAAVRAIPVAAAHAALAREDGDAAARLSPNDTTRVARALEVVRSTGKPLSHWQAERVGGIGNAVRLGAMILLPPRDWLFERCNARFSAMLDGGAMDEVQALLARKLDPALPVMRAIGVREVSAILADPAVRAEQLKIGQIATRQYAKRQYTWFRNQPPPGWMRVEAQLDDDFVNDLAIKLQHMALT